jgi:hypothetical protein
MQTSPSHPPVPRAAARLRRAAVAAAWLLAAGAAAAQVGWRSALFPVGWEPPESANFATDKLIQDFSHAGYRNGEAAPPAPAGPLFEVTAFGADPTGAADSTAAIQAAIDAAGAAGGGVVAFPPGLFILSRPAGAGEVLRVAASGVVLRGAGAGSTFLLNTSTAMRGAAVVRVRPFSTGLGPVVAMAADLTGPVRRWPVADAAAFAPGDLVRLEWDFTDEWIAEHGQQTWWNGVNRPASSRYRREVLAVDPAAGWIEVDAPARYAALLRDGARLRKLSGYLRECGVENLSLGNLMHPGSGFLENDYAVAGTAAWDAHDSWLLDFIGVRDCWARGVASFRAAANSAGCHMLSNGIRMQDSFRVTLEDCRMERAQYGGGGGNGYMFRVNSANECLLDRCVAEFSRHGFVIALAGTSGNVFRRCEDRVTRRATGAGGSYTTSGEASDNHMHFSHSNLWDQCHAHDSYWTAHHRGSSGTVPHGLTSAHAVYWNTSGSGTRYSNLVVTEQARYGYVIGTSGTVAAVSSRTGGNTSPADHVEGAGLGADLQPASLYDDQLARRLGLPAVAPAPLAQPRFPDNTIRLAANLTVGGLPATDFDTVSWQIESMPAGAGATAAAADSLTPAFAVSQPGTYGFALLVTRAGRVATGTCAVEVLAPLQPNPFADLVAQADAYVRDGTYAAQNFGTETTILVKNDNSTNVRREGFLRFDLTDRPTWPVARVEAVLNFISTDRNATLETSLLADDNWSETGITWNNRPSTATTVFPTWTPPAGGPIALDLTAAVLAEAAGDGLFSLRHRVVAQSGSSVYSFASREAVEAARWPRLRFHRQQRTLEEWLGEVGGLPPGQLEAAADPDRDGLPNLMEALLGTDPGRHDGWAAPALAAMPAEVQIAFETNPDPPAGLYFLIEDAPSPAGPWQPTPGVIWENPPGPGPRLPQLARIPHAADLQSRFFRMRAGRL